MSNAAIDFNSKQTAIARLKTDDSVLVRLTANPTTGSLITSTVTVGTTPKSFSATDENGRTSWFAVSENDGVTPVALRADSTGALIIKNI